VSKSVEALASADVIAWARRMSGLEVEDVAQRLRTSSERVASWERGESRPTIAQLRKLADLYKRPLAVFYLDKPPDDERLPTDFRRIDPRQAATVSSALRLAIRRADLLRETAIDLMQQMEERLPAFKLTADLSDDPEECGAALRDLILAGASPPRGDPQKVFRFWRDAAESNAGVLVLQAERIPIDEMRGLSISQYPLPVVVLNMRDVPAARSFSLFHELVHLMLHRGGICLFDEWPLHGAARQIETFCNRVAGAALVPRDALLGDPETPKQCVSSVADRSLAALARRYGVSAEVILRRLVLTHRVDRAFYDRKRAEYLRRYAELAREKPRSGFRSPSSQALATRGRFFTELVLTAYDAERITGSDLAEYLGVRLRHLPEIRAALQRKPPASKSQ
jgi:Zn-dependent peptidase ImmA (M78 family)/transcriptional regulator with XRE-family HTH domain